MVILALALFVRFDWDTKHYIQILEAEFLWNGSYILMVSSGLVIICSLLGCWATANEHPGLCRVVSDTPNQHKVIYIEFKIRLTFD